MRFFKHKEHTISFLARSGTVHILRSGLDREFLDIENFGLNYLPFSFTSETFSQDTHLK